MTKVLIATEKPFASQAASQIREVLVDAGFEVSFLEKYTERQQLFDAVADADALIIRSDKIDAEVMDAAHNLKIVVRAGAGYDNVALEAATERNVVVMNTPGQNSNAVAELAFGMMVYQIRNHFNGTSGTELLGKVIGIHAYGHVGRQVARIAKGFGMEVMAFDPFVPAEKMMEEGVIVAASREELYHNCDFISLHIPATSETKGSINFDLLSGTREGAVLVNTARKEVIDEEGLVQWLDKVPGTAYISDIAPGNADQLTEQFGHRVFFTPKKMGAQTAEANTNAGLAAARQIIDFVLNGNLTYKVN